MPAESRGIIRKLSLFPHAESELQISVCEDFLVHVQTGRRMSAEAEILLRGDLGTRLEACDVEDAIDGVKAHPERYADQKTAKGTLARALLACTATEAEVVLRELLTMKKVEDVEVDDAIDAVRSR